MKKAFIRIIVCMLSVVMIFATACVKNDGGSAPVEKSNKIYYENGTHIFNVGTTEHSLVANGATDYQIVYPEEISEGYVFNAANELRDVLKSATGANFVVKTDAGLTYAEDTKYISLGNTTIFEGSGIVLNSEQLEGDGFRIVTKGQNIIINGINDYAVYYGAYELLAQLIDYDFYGWGAEYYETNVTDLALPDFDITDVGDFVYRVVGTAHVRGTQRDRARMRMESDSKIFMPVNGAGAHNSVCPEPGFRDKGYFPLETYGTGGTNPRPFYSTSENELCYTAHGDPDVYAEMQAIALDRMKTAILENPTMSYLTFTQSDISSGNCGCDACMESKEYYGSESAAYVIFVNKVVKELNKWREAEGIRHVYVASFAYNWSFEPPTKNLDAEELQVEDNYCVFVAPINSDFFNPINETSNVGTAATIKNWSNIVDNVMVWTYTTYFSNLLLPFCDFDNLQETFSYYLDNKVMYSFCEGTLKFIQPGFTVLKVWLQGKLMWNVNSDYEALLDEFFTNYYDMAGDPMRQIFDELRLWMRHLSTEEGLKGNCLHNGKFDEAETWPKQLLDKWVMLIDQAVKNIESYKYSNSDLYNKLYKRIALEAVTFKYLIITHHSSAYTPNQVLDMKLSFRSDCNTVGLSDWGGGKIVDLLKKWGI